VLILVCTVASVAGAQQATTPEHDMYWKFQHLPMPPKLSDAASAKVTGPNIPYGADSVTVLVYRINFPGQTIGLTEAQMTAVHDTVVTRYRQWSANRFKAKFVLHNEVWTSPKKYSSSNPGDWGLYMDFCEQKITATGVNFDDPGPTTRLIVVCPNFGYNSSAAPPLITMMSDMYSAWCIIHEMGHCLALLHTNGLEAGTNIVGVENYTTENIEYGGMFCNMGIGYDVHINPIYKNYFRWWGPNDVKNVTTTGAYKLYAHDQPVRGLPPQAITLRSGNGKYTYWLEYRVAKETTRQGIILYLAGYLNNKPGSSAYNPLFWDTVAYMLDMTPNSVPVVWWGDDFLDAPLKVGKSFSDPFGGFTVKVLGVNQGVWNENGWAELEITVPGTFVISQDKKQVQFKYNTQGFYPAEQMNSFLVYNLLGQRVTDFKPDNINASKGVYILNPAGGQRNVKSKAMLIR